MVPVRLGEICTSPRLLILNHLIQMPEKDQFRCNRQTPRHLTRWYRNFLPALRYYSWKPLMASLNSVPLLSSSSHRTVSAEMSFLLTRPRPAHNSIPGILSRRQFAWWAEFRRGGRLWNQGQGGRRLLQSEDWPSSQSCKTKFECFLRNWPHTHIMYRVAQNHGKQVLRISHTILSFLDEIASASQQLPFFTRSAQLPLLSKVSCSDLFAHEEWQQTG